MTIHFTTTGVCNHVFYHGCNILTNQIAQKEIDKSLIQTYKLFINLQVIYQPASAACVFKVIKWAE